MKIFAFGLWTTISIIDQNLFLPELCGSMRHLLTIFVTLLIVFSGNLENYRENVESRVENRNLWLKLYIIERNFDFGPKFWFCTKIPLLDENFNFLTKISIFDPNLNFWPNFRFGPNYGFYSVQKVRLLI